LLPKVAFGFEQLNVVIIFDFDMGSHEPDSSLKGMPEVILAEISGETALTP